MRLSQWKRSQRILMLIPTSMDNRKLQVSRYSVCVKNVESVSSKMKTNQYQGVKNTHTQGVCIPCKQKPTSLSHLLRNELCLFSNPEEICGKSLSFSKQMLAAIMKATPVRCLSCLKPLPFSGRNTWRWFMHYFPQLLLFLCYSTHLRLAEGWFRVL